MGEWHNSRVTQRSHKRETEKDAGKVVRILRRYVLLSALENNSQKKEESEKAVSLYTKYEGNWNQIWGSSEFREMGLAQKKFENHVRSQLKRVRKQTTPNKTKHKGDKERTFVLKSLKRKRRGWEIFV